MFSANSTDGAPPSHNLLSSCEMMVHCQWQQPGAAARHGHAGCTQHFLYANKHNKHCYH